MEGEPSPGPLQENLPEARRVGLIAGGGRFPFVVAEGARRRGVGVVCAGIRYEASPELSELCESFRVFSLGRLNAVLRYLKREGVREVCWAGWIRKERIFGRWRWLRTLPDWRILKVYLFKVRNRQDHTILTALAEEFESEGIRVMHSATYCPEILAESGVLTNHGPTPSQLEDIRFGWTVAKRMADLDVGQSVCVCEKSTLTVEGIEGTDRNIRRAGEFYRRGGFTVVKLAKQSHDMRFDIPTIGPDTIETIYRAGGAVLAVEAERTLILDRDATIAAANRHGIVIVAYREPPSP